MVGSDLVLRLAFSGSFVDTSSLFWRGSFEGAVFSEFWPCSVAVGHSSSKPCFLVDRLPVVSDPSLLACGILLSSDVDDVTDEFGRPSVVFLCPMPGALDETEDVFEGFTE